MKNTDSPRYSDNREEQQPFIPAAQSRAPKRSEVTINIPGWKKSPVIDYATLPEKPKICFENKEALKIWLEAESLDRFLEQLYQYYYGKGMSVVMINRISNLFIMAFVVSFALILGYCVKWSILLKPATEATHPILPDVLRPSGIFEMSFFMYICVAAFWSFWIWQLWLLVTQEYPKLKVMKAFFNKVLLIPDDDLPSEDFNEIVNRLKTLQKSCPRSEGDLDARSVANRIMRRENYLIALFNKEVVDFSFLGSQSLPKTLEWNLSFAILSYIFDENFTIKPSFLKLSNRKNMAEGLKQRFRLLGLLNAILSPFILVFLLLYFAFKYGEEIYKDPKIIGDRQYTSYARWKLREFNELPHFFDRRLSLSHKKAMRYMEQFHSAKLIGLGKLVGFIAGSLCFVMILLTIINEDLLMHFEITAGKSLIWYLAVFGTILAITRSLIPDPLRAKDPAKLMTEIQEFTHYMPAHWKENLYSEKVRNEFGQLFQYQLIQFMQEVSAVLWTPIMLWFILPKRAEQLVEFFREFTVHVDGLGYVCSFALFDFKRHGNPKYGSSDLNGERTGKYLRSKQGKLEKSFISFAKNYPDWVPDQQGSMYISRLREFEQQSSINIADQSKDLEVEESSNGLMNLLQEYYNYRQK